MMNTNLRKGPENEKKWFPFVDLNSAKATSKKITGLKGGKKYYA